MIFRLTEFADNNEHKTMFTKPYFNIFYCCLSMFSCSFQLLQHLLYRCIELASGVFICV